MQTHDELKKQAQQVEKEKRFGEAAVLWERCGDVQRAIDNYTKAGCIDRAADLLRLSGKGMAAAELYESVGEYLKAANVYEGIFEFAPAAAALAKAGDLARAAALYEQADALEEAAGLYVELGNRRKAAQLLERAGKPDRANELLAAAATEGVSEADPELDLSSAAYVDAGKVIETVVRLLRAGRTDDAARLYGNCREDIGYAVLAALAGDGEAERCAAEMFVCANDFRMAAQIFENLADYQSAAAMYERADDPYLAAEMHVMVGARAEAAELFEKSGHFRQAAEHYAAVGSTEKAAACYERAGDCFIAGRLYAGMNRPDRAIPLLQKVGRGDSEYLEASRLLGEALIAGGQPELAARKLGEALQGAEPSDKTAPAFLALAAAHEGSGRRQEARALYEKIAAWRPGYGDVAARLRAAADPVVPAPAAAPVPAPHAPRPGGNVVAMMEGFEFLASLPMFRELSREQIQAVYDTCETRRFAAGETLIEQDRPGEALFIVRKGTARVVRVAADKQDVVARLGPGSPAGEMALVDDAATSARVVAETELEAFCITRPRFEKLLASSDAMALKLYRFFVHTLARRLRSTSIHLAGLVSGRRAEA